MFQNYKHMFLFVQVHLQIHNKWPKSNNIIVKWNAHSQSIYFYLILEEYFHTIDRQVLPVLANLQLCSFLDLLFLDSVDFSLLVLPQNSILRMTICPAQTIQLAYSNTLLSRKAAE